VQGIIKMLHRSIKMLPGQNGGHWGLLGGGASVTGSSSVRQYNECSSCQLSSEGAQTMGVRHPF